jgi:hypothetical protein
MGRISVVGLIASAVVGFGVTGCASLRHAPARSWAIDREITGALSSGSSDGRILDKCSAALWKAGVPYGVVHMAIGTAGSARVDDTGVAAPYYATMIYMRQGGEESRSRLVDCHLNAAGEVVRFEPAAVSPR